MRFSFDKHVLLKESLQLKPFLNNPAWGKDSDMETIFTLAEPLTRVDPYLDKEWDSRWGRQKIVARLAYQSGDLYKVATLGKDEVRLYAVITIDAAIKSDLHRTTPVFAAEVAAQHTRYLASEVVRKEDQARAALLNEKLTRFTTAQAYTALKSGQAKKALSSSCIYANDLMTQAVLVETLVAAGRVPVKCEVDKIKPMTRRAFNRADNDEQRAHERKIEEAGKKTLYTLNSHDGFEMDVGVFGYAYARHLIAQAPKVTIN